MAHTEPNTRSSENALDVVSRVASDCGWEIDDEPEPMFQESVSFVARTNLIGYGVNVSYLTTGVLHVELVIEVAYVPFLIRPEFMRLLNLINQNISVGSLVFTSEYDDADEETTERKFLIHRSQLYFDERTGLSDDQAARLITASVEAFDLCLPHVSTFLATKPRAVLDPESGEIIEAYLRLTPEDTLDLILDGPITGHA